MFLTKEFLDVTEAKSFLENALREYFKKAKMEKAVVGISGGKDSAVVLAMCTAALGCNNVIAVKLFNSDNSKFQDVKDADDVIKACGIPNGNIFNFDIQITLYNMCRDLGIDYSEEAAINIAPRVRMTYLRAIAQKNNGLLVGTGNLSETIVGYYTKDGDGSWDINPIGNLTSIEVVKLGHLYKLPAYIVDKTPDDGLSGKSDEEKLGISYELIHRFIREYANNIEIVKELTEDKDIMNYVYDMKTEKIYQKVYPKYNSDQLPSFNHIPVYGTYPRPNEKNGYEEVTNPLIVDLIPIIQKMIAAKHKNKTTNLRILTNNRKDVINVRDLLYFRTERNLDNSEYDYDEDEFDD